MSNEVGDVAALRRTDYQVLIVATNVVIQPVCGHTHIQAVAGCRPHICP